MTDPEFERLKRVTIILREREVVLDADLAALLGIETKRLNEAIRRHCEIFPRTRCSSWRRMKSSV